MSLIIRSFNGKDLTQLIELRRIFETESGWKPPKDYLEEFSKIVLGIHRRDPNLLKVAEIDNKLVGYCIATDQLHSYEGLVLDITWRSAYVWDMFIVSEYRRHGIGTKLPNGMLAYLKQIGKQKVYLIVNYWNESGKKFFEKNEFELWGYFLSKEI